MFFNEDEDNEEEPKVILDIEESVDLTGRLINQKLSYNKLVSTEVSLQQGNSLQTVKVTCRLVGPEVAIKDSHDYNPMFKSLLYDIEFNDRQVKQFPAKVIAKNILDRLNSNGFLAIILKAITEHKKDDPTVDMSYEHAKTFKDRKMLQQSSQSLKLKVILTDGTETCKQQILLRQDMHSLNLHFVGRHYMC